MTTTKMRKMLIGLAAAVAVLGLASPGLLMAVFSNNCNAVTRLKAGMTRAEVRSDLRYYRESAVDWGAVPGNPWHIDDQREMLSLGNSGEVEVCSYRLLIKPIYVAYDKADRVVAVQGYD